MTSDYRNDPALNTEDKADIKRIFDFITRPEDLDESDTWPCVHIQGFESYLKPPSTNTDDIPSQFIPVLEFDVRNLPTALDRVDHVRFYITDELIAFLKPSWKLFLIKFLHKFCEMTRPRDRNQWDLSLIHI